MNTPPTMCADSGDPPRLPDELAHALAVTELLALRVEHQVQLCILAQEASETLDVHVVHYSLSHLATLATRLRSRLQSALAVYDAQLADIDVMANAADDDEDES